MRHEVKSWPEYFSPINDGIKTFELRRNDRSYQLGDILVLKEWEPTANSYTGRSCERRIVFVLYGAGSVGAVEPMKGLNAGYVILGLADVGEK